MGRLDFMFASAPDPAGCFLGSEYPSHDGRWPYDAYRGPGHLMWWEELVAKQKALCYYDTDQERVSFTTRAAPGLVEGVYKLVDLSEFKRRAWRPVTPRRTCLLADVLVAIRNGTLPQGWIYLSDREQLSAATECLFLPDEDVEPDQRSAPAEAARQGFRRRGLASAEMGVVASWAREEPRQADGQPPSVDRLFALLSRLRHLHPDAFPEHPSPPPPPPPSPSVEKDRKLYDSLGPERPDSRCNKEGCSRGTVPFSVMCRVHHFEMVTGQTCPFRD